MPCGVLYLEHARSEKKMKKSRFFLRKRLTIIGLFEGMCSVGTRFRRLAPVLGPELFLLLAMSPSSTVHGGQYDTTYVAFE